MRLNIGQNGIVWRQEDGTAVILRPGRTGGKPVRIEVPTELADEFRLATGDVVEGEIEAISFDEQPEYDEQSQDGRVSAIVRVSDSTVSDSTMVSTSDDPSRSLYREDDVDPSDSQRDEPTDLSGATRYFHASTNSFLSARLVTIARINGLEGAAVEERPFPRRRNASERLALHRHLTLAKDADDFTGRLLDFAAPLGMGAMGIVHGAHGSGLTRSLLAVAAGITQNDPDILIFILLLKARGEEMTDWRRRFPDAEIVVCPTLQDGASPEQTLRMADLMLACAQRQTELGRHVLMLVDSLTGIWASMLEAEGADEQSSADQAAARQRMREWVQKAGDFGGEGPLGGSLGGSLTIVGSLWNQEPDAEAEEDRELHPHLRLLEHILHETNWRIALSDELARRKLYPTIDVLLSEAANDRTLLGEEEYALRSVARQQIKPNLVQKRFQTLTELLDTTPDNTTMLRALAEGAAARPDARARWDSLFGSSSNPDAEVNS